MARLRPPRHAGISVALLCSAMLRAECIEDTDGHVTVRLHGRIGGQWVSELRGVCLRLRERGFPRLQMDLENVTFIDHDGLALLDELWEWIDVTRTSLFAHELLRTIANDRVARGRHHEHTVTNSHER